VSDNCGEHTYGPDNYCAWHEWAARKIKTHSQRRCPGCGLYLIWVARAAEVRRLMRKETK
jgi:hypothetical protein